ncbi:16S rRNA (cytosine(1402)-N(4))-methyltransferase RsmH [Mycoplasmopsis gallinacea]|uniref:Ribosomal RNA small subunit methyltransferase H n=1 Tax=Mycoplasmopsis gallinacea TaxID=29556 RepID=A0A449A468_9BACT|nr:16S rRNA (cytosine(1402)-N(4))-methyltransferase RsmH [Mycoplasmopsis gallinacea]VEU59004.1 Ribosomal RNA small subunit methyltransferase H [Mycoplasmopsis gallinacea]
MKNEHYSVLLNESIDALNIKPDGIYVDLTLGMGGHSEQILKRLTTGKLYAFDKDEFALEQAGIRLSKVSDRYELIKSDFKEIKSELAKRNIYQVDGIIADLGISSPQVDNSERGFSYNKDARLDMRMDQTQEFSAYEVVNGYELTQLEKILINYADVKLAYRVAKAICDSRPIETTMELVEIIKSCYPAKMLRAKNPAKAVFQAIRIEVNNELESLKQMLNDALSLLKTQATLAIITFHSIEDKIVKNFYANISRNDIPSKMPIMIQDKYFIKQIKPSKVELEENKRSRSAKLRIVRRLF